MAAEEKRVYMLTSKGNAELTGANTALSAADLKLLVMIDGEASVEQIAKLTESQLPAEKVAAMLRDLARSGYVADPDGTAAINVGDFFKEADLGLSSLQQKGFFVRIARRPAPKKPEPGAKPAEKKKPTVLVVEDDPQLAKMLRTFLKMEDFVVHVAATREEINQALREAKPDVVLLDVVLPDLDGFDVLARMRQHEATKSVPIIMATAKATREAVLEGLRRGADGYVTKPYDVPVLLTAMKTVLGIA